MSHPIVTGPGPISYTLIWGACVGPVGGCAQRGIASDISGAMIDHLLELDVNLCHTVRYHDKHMVSCGSFTNNHVPFQLTEKTQASLLSFLEFFGLWLNLSISLAKTTDL